MTSLIPILLSLGLLVTVSGLDCSKLEYERCAKMADPLLKEVHLIFPDNADDIDIVCRTWNGFVDCLKRYTEKCFNEQERRQFNQAVENPIESVHQMCMQPAYQQEYLLHAPCMKNTVIDNNHCGQYYNLLVDQVDQGDIISKATLCCSHDRFKQCVLTETREACDRGNPDGAASRFSKQIIDKALSFLQDQCYNYIPNSGDCSTSTTDNTSPFSDPVMISTGEAYPWGTEQEAAAKEIPPSIMTPPRSDSTATWSASSFAPAEPVISTSPLGTRSRPASYGRASSWFENPTSQNTQPGLNTLQTQTDRVDTTTPSSRPSYATVSTWHIMSQSPDNTVAQDHRDALELEPRVNQQHPTIMATTETWYPAAGNQLSNEVDEPNQQGLTKHDNSGSRQTVCVVAIVAVGATVFAFT